ncbi:hypothetical protein DFA_04898 [Cavenderia fasciculata]|uniref:ComC supersandwich domain-containing protein n=1 Tax=Cavenderia fasciculata TaxID=261658 RepID=F4PMB8_CACFS|nr:uncharacterized protein DFA_04898 [Cavenderia fasciculata]EGG22768.1 hypothetical protein DFA_04898 [Cavenderia fasciculata]|eukprot:XP_004360619.1 hypothetical protein DFA_04898 [Cavenderia fasciculata]
MSFERDRERHQHTDSCLHGSLIPSYFNITSSSFITMWYNVITNIEPRRRQYGLFVPPATICQSQYYVCSLNVTDGQYHLTEMLIQNVGREVANVSLNLLESLKTLKQLQTIVIENDPTINYVPPDFTDFPRLSLFSLSCPGLTSLPSNLLNNSAVATLAILRPVLSLVISPSLYLPQLASFRISLNCTGPSHSINFTPKSFPLLSTVNIFTVENANITVHFNLIRQSSITCMGASPWNQGQCHLRIGNASVITSLNLRYNHLLSIPSIPQSLRQLDLDGNNLTTLNVTMVGAHTGLEVLRVSNNTQFIGPITEDYCAHQLNVLYTLVESLPDCFWCYINASNVGPYVLTSLTFPSKFFCNVTIENANNIVTNNGKYTLIGKNLGWGYEDGTFDYLLTKVVANSKLDIAFSGISNVPTNFTLNLLPFDPEPQTQITVVEGGVGISSLSLQTFINETGSESSILLKGTFNNYFVHYGRVGSRNCSFLVFSPPNEQMCIMFDLSPGTHTLTFYNDYYSTSAVFQVASFPKIDSITPLPAAIGSVITLSGNFGPSVTPITVKFYSATIFVSDCLIVSFAPSTIACQVNSPLVDQIAVAVSDGTNTGSILVSNQLICQQSTNDCYGNGICGVDGICVCNSDGYYNNCSKPYPIISSASYNSTTNNIISINGDFGPSISSFEIVSVKINNTYDCSVDYKSQSLIICTLTNQPNYGLSSVQLQLDSLNTSARNILYLRRPGNGGNNGTTTTTTTTGGGGSTTGSTTSTSGGSTDTPQQLCIQQTSNCYGHGKCDVNGICQCDKDYNPVDNCFTKFINTTITPNTTDPTVSFDIDGIDFQFEVVSIQELDFDSNVVRELFISNYTWIVNAATNNMTTTVDYQLNTTLSSSILFRLVNVLSTISFSTQARDIQFGDQQLHINPNSIKLAINITNWQYSSNLATLRVVFRTIIINNQSVEFDCNQKEIEPLSYDSLSSLQYLRVIKDDIQFNGRFIDVALSDGRPTYSQTQLISMTQSTDIQEQSIALIGINLPQCQSCVLDPDFSPLLIDKSNDSGCDGGSQSNNWRIIVGCVVGGVGAVAITAAAIIAVKKTQAKIRFNKQMHMKLQAMN